MTNLTKVIFACDESGAKGYADNEEAYPGELGLCAGILVPNSHVDKIAPAFQAIVDKYMLEGGKLHIADLDPLKQGELRDDVFAAIREFKLPCFWYAIYVAGFNEAHKRRLDIIESAKAGKRSRIRTSNNPTQPDSLHVALFEGLYGYMLAFCMDRMPTDFDVEVRTDRVDLPIAKSFEAAAIALFDEAPHVKIVKGYDPVEKKPVSGTVTVKTHVPDELKLTQKVENLDLKIVDDRDGLVVAADVLSNSLVYHLKNRPNKFDALNCREAIAGHPLKAQLDSFDEWQTDIVGDIIFRHPKALSA